MNKYLLIATTVFSAVLYTACTDESPTASVNQRPSAPTQRLLDPDLDSVFISKDTANKMIGSYLSSIDYTHNDTSLRSMVINADSLRAYLGNTEIKQVKIMLAHDLNYINSNGAGRNVGYKSTALTIIVAGVSDSGDYIYMRGARVANHAQPCPSNCITDGTGSGDLFPNR